MADEPSKTRPKQTGEGNGPAGKERQGSSGVAGARPAFIPPADIFESKNQVLLLLDMPGADPGSLDVTLERRLLSVSALSTPWTPSDGYTFVAAEYQEGNYQRSFILSDDLDGDRIEASLKDGVLRLTVPKTAPPAAKKIPVNAS